MTHKKFGLRQVRVPLEVLDELHSEHFRIDKGGPMYYRVDLITSRGPGQYVVYRCNRVGDRLRGATKYPFDPIRYARRPRSTAAAPPPAPTSVRDEVERETGVGSGGPGREGEPRPVPGSDADHGNTGGFPPTTARGG